MLFWVINIIVTAYIGSTLLFLLLMAVNRQARRIKSHYLNKANGIILFVLAANLMGVISETIKCHEATKAAIAVAFYIISSDPSNCFSLLIGTLSFAFLFQTIFFFQKNRINLFLTIISFLLLSGFFFYERIVIFITNLYRDYLPSSWSVYYEPGSFLYQIFATILFFAFCCVDFTTIKKTNNAH